MDYKLTHISYGFLLFNPKGFWLQPIHKDGLQIHTHFIRVFYCLTLTGFDYNQSAKMDYKLTHISYGFLLYNPNGFWLQPIRKDGLQINIHFIRGYYCITLTGLLYW
jgi:hypothetical protein